MIVRQAYKTAYLEHAIVSSLLAIHDINLGDGVCCDMIVALRDTTEYVVIKYLIVALRDTTDYVVLFTLEHGAI